MDCVKYWLEVGAALVTVIAGPFAFYVFNVERKERFHDEWSARFRTSFISKDDDKILFDFRSSYSEAKRPWRSEDSAFQMVIDAASEALIGLNWQPDAIPKHVAKYLELAYKELKANAALMKSIKK